MTGDRPTTRPSFGPIILIALVMVAVWWFVYRGDGSTEVDDAIQNASLVGRFVSWEPVDDARGYVNFTITNRGSSSATAECRITVTNSFGDFGFDSLVGERIPAGETVRLRMAINVGEGSFLIDEGEVTDC
jgi:hypothetical protein